MIALLPHDEQLGAGAAHDEQLLIAAPQQDGAGAQHVGAGVQQVGAGAQQTGAGAQQTGAGAQHGGGQHCFFDLKQSNRPASAVADVPAQIAMAAASFSVSSFTFISDTPLLCVSDQTFEQMAGRAAEKAL